MSDKDEAVYRYTPQFEGAHLKGVPKRDLTQRDVDRLDALQRRDAFAPHPAYGTPLYTAVEGPEKTQQEKAITAFEKAEKAAAKAGTTAPKDGEA